MGESVQERIDKVFRELHPELYEDNGKGNFKLPLLPERNISFGDVLRFYKQKRGVETMEKQYVFVKVGLIEIELLGLLILGEQRSCDLDKAGYARSVMKLDALFYLQEYVNSSTGDRYTKITDIGRVWFEENVDVKEE